MKSTITCLSLAILLVAIPTKFSGFEYITANADAPVSVHDAIYDVFGKDAKIMLGIAKCESGARQYDENGVVIVNEKTFDYGALQINQMHIPEALKMGLDVFTLDGNLRFGKHLLDTQGLKSWRSSLRCWGQYLE